MDRFVAMIWDDANPAKQAQVNAWSETLQRRSLRWTVVLDAPGLRVLSLIQRGDAPVVTIWHGADGVVVGPLFERGREKLGRVHSIDQRVAERVISTRGESLIEDYWGNYVALWSDTETRRATVLRDPCGAVSCFITQHNGVDLLFSHADDVAHLPGLVFTIDWTYLQAFILFNYFVTKYTGFKEVIELLGGERLQFGPAGERIFAWAWNGAAIASEPNFQPFEKAKQELRATAEACFAAWGSEYRKFVVSLSGGLDSSIMVNLLRRVSTADAVAQHYLSVGYEQYEVRLARLAAAQAHIDLIEEMLDPAKDEVERILAAPVLARPRLQSLAVLIDDVSTKLADHAGADAFMIGQGGDNLFLQRAGAKHMLADYMRLRGFGKAFWSTAYGASMLERESVWKTLTDAVDTLAFNRKWRPFDFLDSDDRVQSRPLPVDAISAIPLEYQHHPWFIDAARLPRGKADHVVSVVALYNYYVNYWRGLNRDVIYPYFSQPIAEFALRTPTYMLCHDGLDRSLERHAFADLIPDAIARRTRKGGADSYLLHVMEKNISFYRDLVLDGALITLGWLDRDKLERMMTLEYVVQGRGVGIIYRLVSAEGWLKTSHNNMALAAA